MLKNGKAAGINDATGKMLKYGLAIFCLTCVKLLKQVINSTKKLQT